MNDIMVGLLVKCAFFGVFSIFAIGYLYALIVSFLSMHGFLKYKKIEDYYVHVEDKKPNKSNLNLKSKKGRNSNLFKGVYGHGFSDFYTDRSSTINLIKRKK
ncbi:hypothetical protein [Psychromonas sp. KJ10-2]|uniref:hypothetical protein n=1 Tax=Psychromonas sp. KJ10-2 TaxID=3391822 RepID=UPI0039B55187